MERSEGGCEGCRMEGGGRRGGERMERIKSAEGVRDRPIVSQCVASGTWMTGAEEATDSSRSAATHPLPLPLPLPALHQRATAATIGPQDQDSTVHGPSCTHRALRIPTSRAGTRVMQCGHEHVTSCKNGVHSWMNRLTGCTLDTAAHCQQSVWMRCPPHPHCHSLTRQAAVM